MGSEDDFEALYGRYAPAVRRYALRRCDPATADDIVADVFLIAWRRREDLGREPLLWLLATARRVLANHARGEHRRVRLLDRLAAEPPVLTTTEEAYERLEKALATLSEQDRELLLLVAWEGLKPSEAGQVLGVRPNTVAVRFHRARRRLSDALDACGSADSSSHHQSSMWRFRVEGRRP